jgi:hypothetical protein
MYLLIKSHKNIHEMWVNVLFLNAKRGGTYNNHCHLKCHVIHYVTVHDLKLRGSFGK